MAGRQPIARLSHAGLLEMVSLRLMWFTGDEVDGAILEYRRAPGDHLGHRQISLLECLQDHAQALFDGPDHQAFVAHLVPACSLPGALGRPTWMNPR